MAKTFTDLSVALKLTTDEHERAWRYLALIRYERMLAEMPAREAR